MEFSVNADYNQVLKVDSNGLPDPIALEQYKIALIDEIVRVTGTLRENIVIISITPGSIVNQVIILNNAVPPLQQSVDDGTFVIKVDKTEYPAIPDTFIVINNICFYKGTMILTPHGYRAVETLNARDVIKTAQGRHIKIKKVTRFNGIQEHCPLYVLHRGSLDNNIPLMDVYMSGGHAFRYNGSWCHMKCSSLTMKLDIDNIEYYNIVLDNYLEHTLLANGVEVESLFNIKGLEMSWKCDKDNCKPVIKKQIV